MNRVVDPPGGPFAADLAMPGDKSLSHRALILAALARGESNLHRLGPGADIASTGDVLEAIGVELDDGLVRSPGIAGWTQPGTSLDCGNSGTTIRLMTGALAGSSIEATLVGDRSLMRRPMRRVAEPLTSLGARIATSSNGTAPITVRGSALRGTSVHVPFASAQVRTAVALAAVNATGATLISSPTGFRDHTERWLESLRLGERIDESTFRVDPGAVPPLDLCVPGDPSSASFLWAAAAVRPGSRVTTRDISLNPGRLGFLGILRDMGCEVDVEVKGEILGDPRGDVTVAHAPLRGTTVSGVGATRAIDELPLVAVVASRAEGTTTVADAGELRVKESDRLLAAVELARVAGGSGRTTDDGFIVGGDPGKAPRSIDTQGDHRIAMAAAVAAVARREAVEIVDASAADVSWPGFWDTLEAMWS